MFSVSMRSMCCVRMNCCVSKDLDFIMHVSVVLYIKWDRYNRGPGLGKRRGLEHSVQCRSAERRCQILFGGATGDEVYVTCGCYSVIGKDWGGGVVGRDRRPRIRVRGWV